jgi:hypothetical protein
MSRNVHVLNTSCQCHLSASQLENDGDSRRDVGESH